MEFLFGVIVGAIVTYYGLNKDARDNLINKAKEFVGK